MGFDLPNHPINIRFSEAFVRLRPLQDRILVRRLEPEAVSAGGIFIPDTAQEKASEGEVVAAGPGLRDRHGQVHPVGVAVGDRVLFAKWSGDEIRLASETFVIIPEADIIGVIEPGF